MCRFDRNTDRRGRAAVPFTFLRTRRCRRSLPSSFRGLNDIDVLLPAVLLLRGLAGLSQHALVGVTDALALVRLRLADLADVGCDLADGLLVGAPYDDARRRRYLERDALGRVDVHRVREAELELDARRALRIG